MTETANISDIYDRLKTALKAEVQRHNFAGQKINIHCKALSAKEAIGTPEQDDYPIIRGREVMVEADFRGAKGQAFTDEYESAEYSVEDLLNMELETNRKRSVFVAGFNAIFRYLDLCDKTIHCRNEEPKDCADMLPEAIASGQKVLLIGHQPRFLEKLASFCDEVRAVDLDAGNIGKTFSGVTIEPPEMTEAAIKWCDMMLVTGSTLVNGSIVNFLGRDKPVLFFGVTISGPAKVLNLKKWCQYGH